MHTQLLEKAKDLFLRYGVKNVTMDMIAYELGISKRTLYETIKDKKTLIYRTMQYFINQHKEEMNEIFNKEEKSVRILAEITGHAMGLLSRIHPSLIFEIKRYYPEAWKLVEDFLATFVIERFTQLLNKGQKEGVFDANLNSDFIARLHYHCIMGILDDTYFDSLNLDKKDRVYHYFYFLIRGICTEKGIKEYHEEITQILLGNE